MTSAHETERIYSYNTRARTGREITEIFQSLTFLVSHFKVTETDIDRSATRGFLY